MYNRYPYIYILYPERNYEHNLPDMLLSFKTIKPGFHFIYPSRLFVSLAFK
jgi:hypothetical protein